MEEISNYLNTLRREFSGKPLDKASVPNNPIQLFTQWFEDAVGAQALDPNAMVLSTVSATGKPSARVVLLRGLDNGEFCFYTNYTSKKAEEMNTNPSVSLTFLWLELNRQIRVEGIVKRLSPAISDQYFASRPRESQIGAWASNQSHMLNDRAELEVQLSFYQSKFEDNPVPRPDFWGGYAVSPSLIEFWQGRPSRLHDRIVYENENGLWVTKRLAP